MSFMDFAMELLFTLFIVLLAMVGLLFVGAVAAGAFFLLLALGGWIISLSHDETLRP